MPLVLQNDQILQNYRFGLSLPINTITYLECGY